MLFGHYCLTRTEKTNSSSLHECIYVYLCISVYTYRHTSTHVCVCQSTRSITKNTYTGTSMKAVNYSVLLILEKLFYC